MSKSYNNTIPVFETPRKLKKIINKIVTDSKALEDAKNPDTCAVFDLYRLFADENQRQLYGRRCNQSVEARVCPPPITTDQEVLSEYALAADGSVAGTVRLLGYLNPNDRLYFSAKQRAVTISDYALRLERAAQP